jgi:hypothetical protein
VRGVESRSDKGKVSLDALYDMMEKKERRTRKIRKWILWFGPLFFMR